MKNILKEEDVDQSLLTAKQRKEIQQNVENRAFALEDKMNRLQSALMDREDEINYRIAKAVGFDGYESGPYNYMNEKTNLPINPSLDSEATRLRIEQFALKKMQDIEYNQLKNEAQKLTRMHADEREWNTQLYYNEVLADTYEKDVMAELKRWGQKPMSCELYNALSEEEKEALDKPISKTFTMTDGQKVEMDACLRNFNSLYRMGVVTGASCSGTVIDHPYDRFQEDDVYGRWQKGDLVHLKGETNHAYITFPIEDNHPDFIKEVKAQADDWGWIVEQQPIYQKDSLVLRMPHTLDGSSWAQIREEAMDMVEHHMALYGVDDELEAEVDMIREVEGQHGGRIHYTDMMKKNQWFRLTQQLEKIQDQVNESIRAENIKAGKTVDVCTYTYRFPMNADQLADAFGRSGILLDKDSVFEDACCRLNGRDATFIIKDGQARMLGKDEEVPDKMDVGRYYTFAYILAQQVKGTVHPSEDEKGKLYITTMIHPDPKDIETAERFTVKKDVLLGIYTDILKNNNDSVRMLSSVYFDELYEAAMDAHSRKTVQAAQEDKCLDIVDGIRIRKGLDNNVYISCYVNDEKQLAKKMKSSDVDFYRMRIADDKDNSHQIEKYLAGKYYAREIENAQLDREQAKSMKR